MTHQPNGLDDNDILHDGEVLRVPLCMADALQRAIAMHCPPINDEEARKERDAAYAEYNNALTSAWKTQTAADGTWEPSEKQASSRQTEWLQHKELRHAALRVTNEQRVVDAFGQPAGHRPGYCFPVDPTIEEARAKDHDE